MEKILLQCWEDAGIASCGEKELKYKLSLRGNPCDYHQQARVVSLWPLSYGTNCIINVLLLDFTLILLLRVFGTWRAMLFST